MYRTPVTVTVTEVFNYSRTRAARMFELSGRTARNADGIAETLRRLRERFAP